MWFKRKRLRTTLSRLGKYEEALSYRMQALELRKKIFGAEHESVAIAESNMGVILGRFGRHGEALSYQLHPEFPRELYLGPLEIIVTR